MRGLIEEACVALYAAQKDLVDVCAHERTIAAHLAEYLRPLFEGWNVDTEYNREGRKGDPKRDERGRLFPDIIIHTRGQRVESNLAAIEVKGHWNGEDRRVDEEKLRRIRAEYGYQYLFRLELNEEEASLISVEVARAAVATV